MNLKHKWYVLLMMCLLALWFWVQLYLNRTIARSKILGGGGGGLQGSPRYSSALIVNKEPKLFVAEHTMPLHDPIKICKYIQSCLLVLSCASMVFSKFSGYPPSVKVKNFKYFTFNNEMRSTTLLPLGYCNLSQIRQPVQLQGSPPLPPPVPSSSKPQCAAMQAKKYKDLELEHP